MNFSLKQREEIRRRYNSRVAKKNQRRKKNIFGCIMMLASLGLWVACGLLF